MAIKERLIDDERDDLTKDVNDLDAAYLERLREDGVDPELLEQFKALALEINVDNDEAQVSGCPCFFKQKGNGS